jgi:hypothetical protein
MVEAVEQLPGPELNPQYCQKKKKKKKNKNKHKAFVNYLANS